MDKITAPGKTVAFYYEPNNWIECTLQSDGSLKIRTTGHAYDIVGIEPDCANTVCIRPRRWVVKRRQFEPVYTKHAAKVEGK